MYPEVLLIGKFYTVLQYFKFNIETAGNLLTLYNQLNKEPKTDGFYRLFSTRYSQYILQDFDYRKYHVFDENRGLIYRLSAGVIYPYGNAISIPFEKQFAAGGANSIRGWLPQTVGPGSYNQKDSGNYANYKGDIKIEGNLEYRSKLFWIMEGALFADAGNVWTIHSDSLRSGGQFKPNNFYKEIAVAVGTGLRFKWSFAIIRLDAGLKAYNPALDQSRRWIFKQKGLLLSDFSFNFALGYPF